MVDRDLPVWMRLNLKPDTIAEVVTRLNRVRPDAQKKLAQDIVTIAYLEAGRRLIAQHVRGSATAEEPRTFLDWLTREAICAEVARGPDPLPKQASDGSFRDRWRSKDDYLTDLIAYVYWNLHREPNRQLAQDMVRDLLDPAAPFAAAVEEAAYQDLSLTTDSEHAGARLTQIALQPLVARDPSARAALCTMYAERLQVWSEAYQRILDGRGARLRPDVTIDELSIILTAVADGLAMRALVEGTDNIMNDEARTSLLGTTAMVLLLACVDHGDGRSVKDFLNELGQIFRPQPQPPARRHA